ncbi:MAG: 3-dehydroquinate synthase, partial [Burkholderiales bacterium]|nr:3-dehydroquinate synthase [Burkholderiales bacterium]
YIQVPTTVLAMVDSSVGGKTAINTNYGKNLIGAFYQPQAVIMDLNLLNQLPKIQLINGVVEAFKIFLTSDAKSFIYATSHLDAILKRDNIKLQRIIKNAVKLKVAVVKADELEENLRMILNFGHTIGHALEKVSKFQILHGYAVALGILVEAKIAQLIGFLSQINYDLIAATFYRLGINCEMLYSFNLNAVVEATLSDKKTKNNQIYCILLEDIGKVHCNENGTVATLIDKDIIYQAFAALK